MYRITIRTDSGEQIITRTGVAYQRFLRFAEKAHLLIVTVEEVR